MASKTSPTAKKRYKPIIVGAVVVLFIAGLFAYLYARYQASLGPVINPTDATAKAPSPAKMLTELFNRNVQSTIMRDNRESCNLSKVDDRDHCISISKPVVKVIGGTTHAYAYIQAEIDNAAHFEGGSIRLLYAAVDALGKSMLIDSGYMPDGNGGGLAPHVELIQINRSGEMGWLVSSGFTNQGLSIGTDLLYALADGKIHLMGRFETLYDNTGQLTTEEEAEKGLSLTGKLEPVFDGLPADEPAALNYIITVKRGTGQQEVQRFTVPFNSRVNQYVIPEAAKKMFPSP